MEENITHIFDKVEIDDLSEVPLADDSFPLPDEE